MLSTASPFHASALSRAVTRAYGFYQLGEFMILAPIVGLSLLVSVSLDPIPPDVATPGQRPQLTTQQKNAATSPFVRSATDCIVRSVIADPRFTDDIEPVDINELIVDSMAACVAPVRAMIDAYDRYFGQGSGEAFFMGPYLDILPVAVGRRAKAITE
jgi:hypothetical protein